MLVSNPILRANLLLVNGLLFQRSIISHAQANNPCLPNPIYFIIPYICLCYTFRLILHFLHTIFNRVAHMDTAGFIIRITLIDFPDSSSRHNLFSPSRLFSISHIYKISIYLLYTSYKIQIQNRSLPMIERSLWLEIINNCFSIWLVIKMENAKVIIASFHRSTFKCMQLLFTLTQNFRITLRMSVLPHTVHQTSKVTKIIETREDVWKWIMQMNKSLVGIVFS